MEAHMKRRDRVLGHYELGHADPSLTLRVYAHAMPSEETDLSFADFSVSKRLYTSPADEDESSDAAKSLNSMARREGFEPPTLRFEGGSISRNH